jgi:hypothetical protein
MIRRSPSFTPVAPSPQPSFPFVSEGNKSPVPSYDKYDVWNLRAMPHPNERVELEMKIMRYRQLGRRITDEEFQNRLREQIAELEQKLREIDE